MSGISEGRVVEIAFASKEDAEAYVARELDLAGTWADPDGDGNFCIVGP
ncbi:MAG TPA: hypothetical protein VLE97_02450 [Gaiellaceae bacterium]|nr:hypothetical protein [Gaiellaceae bacterium]